MEKREHLSQSKFTTKACWKLYRSVLSLSTDRHCPTLKHNDRVIRDRKGNLIYLTRSLQKNR